MQKTVPGDGPNWRWMVVNLNPGAAVFEEVMVGGKQVRIIEYARTPLGFGFDPTEDGALLWNQPVTLRSGRRLRP